MDSQVCKFLYVDNEDSDQTVQMCRLIWVLNRHMIVSEGTFCHVVTQQSLTACLTCFILEYFQDYWNLYGVHPVYMNIEDESGNSHAVLLHNSNAMGEFDITLKLCYTVSYLSAFKGTWYA